MKNRNSDQAASKRYPSGADSRAKFITRSQLCRVATGHISCDMASVMSRCPSLSACNLMSRHLLRRFNTSGKMTTLPCVRGRFSMGSPWVGVIDRKSLQ